MLEKSTDSSTEGEKGGNWFSNLPKKFEGFQKTGQLLGLQLVDDTYNSERKISIGIDGTLDTDLMNANDMNSSGRNHNNYNGSKNNNNNGMSSIRPATKDLLKLFSKKDFPIDQLLDNFYSQYLKRGIHDYLVNRLYSYEEADLNFYMAELCYLSIVRGSQSLEKFLQDMSAKSINLYLLIYWFLDSFSHVYKEDELRKSKFERMEKLMMDVENAFKDGIQQSQQQQLQQLPLSSTSIESPLKTISHGFEPGRFNQQNKEKDQRSRYNKSIKIFIENMVNISLTLKKHDPAERKDKLKMYMKRADKWLVQLREKNPKVELFQGIFIPFRSEKNSKFNSTFIVRIIHDEVTCFNTKMRVPYRVALETIDVNELKTSKKKLLGIQSESDDVGAIGDGPEFSEGGAILPGVLDAKSELVVIVDDEAGGMRDTVFNKIDKYGPNFSAWACEQESEEQKLFEPTTPGVPTSKLEKQRSNSNQKGMLSSLLKKNEEETTVDKFHQIFQRSRSLVPEDVVGLKRFKRTFQLQQSHLTPERKEMFDQNIKRFNIYFKEKKNIKVRRASIHTDVNVMNPMREKHQYVSKKSPKIVGKNRKKIAMKDLKVIDVLKFFKNLQRSYPHLEKEIQNIYRYLHYDELEEQITSERLTYLENNEETIASKNITTVTLKRKFPWEDIWEDKVLQIKQKSPFGGFKSYKVRVVIFKGGDDLRQELLAMQLIYKFQSIFQAANISLWLRPYEIIVTSSSSGILEFLPNTYSIDGLKKKVPNFTNLTDFYKDYYGKNFATAQNNFIESLAGYSIVCYLLQFKDRHNGNILIENSGHIIHIDYGFMFSISPGGINFESAPFKLTREYVQLMGGRESEGFQKFRRLLVAGFIAIQKYVDEFIFLVRIMQEDSDLPCFKGFDINVFRDRFKEYLDLKSMENYVNRLINESYDNWRTKQYDNFQKMTNGILP